MALKTTAAQTKNNRAGPNSELVWANKKIVKGNTMFERIYVWFLVINIHVSVIRQDMIKASLAAS